MMGLRSMPPDAADLLRRFEEIAYGKGFNPNRRFTVAQVCEELGHCKMTHWRRKRSGIYPEPSGRTYQGEGTYTLAELNQMKEAAMAMPTKDYSAVGQRLTDSRRDSARRLESVNV